MQTMTTPPPWITWGEARAICREKGLGKTKFLNIMAAKDKDGNPAVKRKVFPGCTQASYERASLLSVLRLSEK